MSGPRETDALRARVLDAVDAAGGTLHDAPALDEFARDKVPDEIDTILTVGLLQGIPNRGDDRLLAVRELALTAPGGRARGSAARPAAFMYALYELVDASTLASALPSDVARAAELAPEEAESVAKFLENDGLIETQTYDGDVSITHLGQGGRAVAGPPRRTHRALPARRHRACRRRRLRAQVGTSHSTQHVEVPLET